MKDNKEYGIETLKANLVPEELLPMIWGLIPFRVRREYDAGNNNRIGFSKYLNWYVFDELHSKLTAISNG